MALSNRIADFYSDTHTKPSQAMRETALHAEVGDEQKKEDPTTLELCERVAKLLGKEDAIFMPSGTMCNEVALHLHCRPGQEVICDRTAHIIHYESGAPAALSGLMIRGLDGQHGIFTAEQVSAALRPVGAMHLPETALVCVEQTANLGGGAIWPLATLEEVAAVAHGAGVATHMDGARLLNAAVEAGVAARDFAAGYDSVWLDFTKGLGCPMGAVLAGSEAFIARAWRARQMFGGGLRQSGFMAAPCLYALENNIDRLAEDHVLAQSIGRRIAQFPKVASVLPVETNIIFFDLFPDGPAAADVMAALKQQGIVIGAFGPHTIRVVTHLDVTEEDGDRLVAALAAHLG